MPGNSFQVLVCSNKCGALRLHCSAHQDSAQLVESSLAGAQEVLRAKEQRVSQKSLAPGQMSFALVQPHAAPLQQWGNTHKGSCDNTRFQEGF